MNSRFEDGSQRIDWTVHVPYLFNEILTNPGTSALEKPLQILGRVLHELAELAIEIDDPRLHLMMMDLTLYEAGDPDKTPESEQREIRKKLYKQCEKFA